MLQFSTSEAAVSSSSTATTPTENSVPPVTSAAVNIPAPQESRPISMYFIPDLPLNRYPIILYHYYIFCFSFEI
jgi:hypothetical protein